MELYEQVKAQINETLKNTILDTMDKRSIRYYLDSSEEEDLHATIFAVNKDISLPKKLRTKARLARPQIDVLYVRARNFSYNTVNSYSFRKANPGSELKPINFLWGDLNNQDEFADTRARIISWTREIFISLSNLYSDRYNLKLYIMPIELYLPDYNGMFVSRIPSFEDLIFLEGAKNSSKQSKGNTEINLLAKDKFFKDQAEIVEKLAAENSFLKPPKK